MADSANVNQSKKWAVDISLKFVSDSLFVSSRPPECNFQSETKIEPDLRFVRLKLLFIRELKVLWYRNFKPAEYHRPSFTKSLIQYWENIEVTDS